MQFPTLQEMQDMSIPRLRNLPIETKEQEDLVQKILDSKVVVAPVQKQVYRGDIPFEIKTLEEEKKWQAVVDEREAEIRGASEPFLASKVEALQAEKAVIEKELKGKFCNHCDSKGWKHKLNCTRVK